MQLDLIFQACNIDYTLDAKDRAEADDGEMESTEWTESLGVLHNRNLVKLRLSLNTDQENTDPENTTTDQENNSEP